MTKKPPRIAIIGYGRMGREVEAACKARGLAVSRTIDTADQLAEATFGPDEIAISFTEPAQEAANIRKLAALGVSMVIGTTGWHEQFPDLKEFVARHKIGLLHATNFSVGVQLSIRLAREAARLFDKFEAYDAHVHEWHHKHKKDAPSGTAKTLAEAVLSGFKRKSKWVMPPAERALAPDELGVSAARGGTAIGYHEVVFDSEGDTITLSHTSKGRAAYAQGAVTAAMWLVGRTGLFTIDDMLAEVLP